MVARVVQEEERSRAGVEHMRNRERPAERRAEALLEIRGFGRRACVEPGSGGVEPGGVEALEDRAAHLIGAAAAAAAGEATGTTEAGESAAFSSRAAAAAARTATSTAACLPADRLAFGAATERVTHRVEPIPGRAKERFAALRRAERGDRSEEHTSELQSRQYLVCRLLLE